MIRIPKLREFNIKLLANVVGPITMISGGRINDLFGPKKVIFVGGLMFGGG